MRTFIVVLAVLTLGLTGCTEQQFKEFKELRGDKELALRATCRRMEPPRYLVVVGQEDLLQVVRDVAPDAFLVGIEDSYFLTNIEEIKRFLQCDRTERLSLSYHDYAITLMGNFSATPGWEKVPVGILGAQDAFYNVTVVWDDGVGLVVYEINPRTDETWPIYWPSREIRLVILER